MQIIPYNVLLRSVNDDIFTVKTAEKQASRVAGLVLCGGRGRRMDGVDKGLVNVDGSPAAKRAAAVLAPLSSAMFISANRNSDLYKDLGVGRVLADERPDTPGPLAGIEAASAYLQSDDTLLIMPCDLLNMVSDVYAALLSYLRAQPQENAVYAMCDDRQHYLCAALRASALTQLTPYLETGQRSVRGWYATIDAKALLFDSTRARFALRNHNNWSDWPASSRPSSG